MIKVTPILGIVEIGQGGELVEAKPAGNSTRWIFDVDGELADELVVQLIEMRVKRPVVTDLIACSFLPRSVSFYDAKPFMSEQIGGLITIRHGGFVHGAQVALPGQEPTLVKGIDCRYRVLIDVLHTATR